MLKKPKLPDRFQESIFKGQARAGGRGGALGCVIRAQFYDWLMASWAMSRG